MAPNPAADELIARATIYIKCGADKYRYNAMQEFCKPFKKILSIGSAGYEPILINATHALDVSPLAGEYLEHGGWKGKYYVGTCARLPFRDHEFEVGVCSEVIEHLPSMGDVEATLLEINRVCKNWFVTTPCKPVPEPDHKWFFTPEQIIAWIDKFKQMSCSRYQVKVYTREIWHFMVKRHVAYLSFCPFCPDKGGVK